MGIKYLVQGAECKCRYGSSPDKLAVKTQSRVYHNDKEGAGKLAATTTDTGTTFKSNSFGSCKKKKNDPCTVTVTAWSNADEGQQVEGAGYFLTEQSKATCPIGGKDCITVVYHGQQGTLSKQNIKNADEDIHAQINPFVNLDELEHEPKESPKLKIN